MIFLLLGLEHDTLYLSIHFKFLNCFEVWVLKKESFSAVLILLELFFEQKRLNVYFFSQNLKIRQRFN